LSLFKMRSTKKMSSRCLSTPSNIASSTSTKSFFKTLRRQIMYYQGQSPTYNITYDFIRVAFFDAVHAENVFWWLFDTLNTELHWIHQSRFLRRPEDRLWLLWAIRLLKTSLKRLHQSHLFRCWGCRKCVRMAYRHHESSLHRHHEIRTLILSEIRIRIFRPIRLFKTSLRRFHPIRFFRFPRKRKSVRMAYQHLGI
jgi:hypothetical protein